jgi:hypothetical protein
VENLKTAILILSFLLSAFSFFVYFKYRKKDFQIALLKEQFNACREIYSDISQMTEELKELYNKHVGMVRLNKQDLTGAELEHLQRWFFIQYFGSRYTFYYNGFRKKTLLLPTESVELFAEYFGYVGDLFENRPDEDLNEEINLILDEKLLEIMEELNYSLGVDELSSRRKTLLGV